MSNIWPELKRIIRHSFRNPSAAVRSLKEYDREVLRTARDETDGRNLLHLAIKYESVPIIKFLLQVGCDFYQMNNNGTTPFHCVLKNINILKKIFYHLLRFRKINLGPDLGKMLAALEFDNKAAVAFFRLRIRKISGGTMKSTVKFLRDKGWTLDDITNLKSLELTKNAVMFDKSMLEYYNKLLIANKDVNVLEVKLLLESMPQCKRITSWVLLQNMKSKGLNSTLISKLLINNGALIDGFENDNISPMRQALMCNNYEKVWMLSDYGAGKIEFSKSLKIFTTRHPIQNLSNFICTVMMMQHKNCRRYYYTPDQLDFKTILNYYITKTFSDVHYFSFNLREYIQEKIRFLYPVIDWIVGLYHLGIQIEELKKTLFISFFECSVDGKLFEKDETYRKNKMIQFNHFDEYYKASDTEIQELQKLKIVGQITAWDFINKPIDEMIPFIRNKKLLNKIKSITLANKHSIHSKILHIKVDEACRRNLLIHESIDVLNDCMPFLNSSYPVVKKIIQYIGVPNLLIIE